MNPSIAAVYDDVISSRLQNSTEPRLQDMYVSTKLAHSHKARVEQASKYEEWCRWCSAEADSVKWTARPLDGLEWGQENLASG